MTVNPISDSNYPSIVMVLLRLISNLEKLISSDDRTPHFIAATQNIRSFCLLCGWRFEDLICDRETKIPEDYNPEKLLIRVAIICGIVAEASDYQLTSEQIRTAQSQLADIWREMQF